jgi:cell division protein FtsW
MKRKGFDIILLAISTILGVVGILIVAGVSAPFSQERFGYPYYFLKRQVLFGFLPGIILGILAFKISLKTLKKIAPVLFFASLVLLGMVFLPYFGLSLGGAKRWVILGPISFQPAEFLKLTFILYLAIWLTKQDSFIKKGGRRSQKEMKISLIAFLIILSVVSLFLIFQPDFSTLGLIVIVAILMYFSAKTPFWYTIIIVLIVGGGLLGLLKLAPYRVQRLLVFLNPDIDPMGIGYQARQAQITVGSGGIFGVGFGMSLQKYGFLPHPISDSIFAIFAEETGFIGSLVLILWFLIFFWRGVEIGKRAQAQFQKLIAFGISYWIALQAFLHIGAMIGLLPLTGIPLPFISYGASHLIAELAGVGLLLNISKKV